MGIHSCSICGNSNPGKMHVIELHSVEGSKCSSFCQDCVPDEEWRTFEASINKKVTEFRKAYMNKMSFKALPDLFEEEI